MSSWNTRNHEEILCARSHGLPMSVEDIHRHSYFPEAASAGLRFIKSFGDAKNSHLLKFHRRFQAGQQLKGQFVEASNPAPTSFVYRRSAFSLNTTIYHELRGFALELLRPAVGPYPRTANRHFLSGRAVAQKGGCRSESSMKYPRYVLTVRSTVG